MTMRTLLSIALLAISLPAFALKVRVCRANDIPCDPPATFTYASAPVPFDAPVRFGSARVEQGIVLWTWTKAGEPSRACTPAEMSEGAAYERACKARIGEPLYVTRAFLIEEE